MGRPAGRHSAGTTGGRGGLRLAARLARGFGTVAMTVVMILALDAVVTYAQDPPDPPTTDIVDHVVTWARNPEEMARRVEVEASLVERCRDSRFVVVTFSGTGMEASHYQANMIQALVENLGGCVMYHWYGHVYHAHASAMSVATAIADVTRDGGRKEVVFLGASFGGIAAEDVAADPAISRSTTIHLRRVIMIATPVDLDDVAQEVLGVPVSAIKDVPVEIPRFGVLIVLANAINGQRQRGQLGDADEWQNTFVNAAKTRAALTWSELRRLRAGMVVDPDIPVDYLASPRTDVTVDTDRAYVRIDALIRAQTRYVIIEDGGHARGWLLSSADRYNEKIAPILQELFGLPA